MAIPRVKPNVSLRLLPCVVQGVGDQRGEYGPCAKCSGCNGSSQPGTFSFSSLSFSLSKTSLKLDEALIIYHLHSCCCHITHSNRLTLSKTSLKQAHDVLSITLQKNTTSYGPLSSSSRLADGNMSDENENIGYHSYRIYPTINYKTSKQHDDDKGKVSWAKRAELLQVF